MTTVLVTGGGERLTEVVAAVEATGAETVSVSALDRIGESVSGRTFDGWVQLPVSISPAPGSLVSRVEQFLTEGLLSRFRAAATVLPSLSPSATVLLVGGQTPVDSEAPDDREARTALMRVLAHALRAERAPERLTVRTVEHSWSAEDIARTVTGETPPRDGAQPTLASSDEAIGQAYADWRAEVLGLMRVEF